MEQLYGSSSTDLLAEPVRGGRALSTLQRQQVDHTASIVGWGSDLDLSIRPGVPRDKAPQLGSEDLYPAIPRQVPPFRIHKSTEHAQLTPVFGTSCPPKGLSGVLRDYAYKFSEGRMSRWMTLMLADRVDVVEGVMSDLAQFHVPNVPKEMGLGSEWKFNRAGVIKKAAIAGLCVGAIVVMAQARGARRRS